MYVSGDFGGISFQGRGEGFKDFVEAYFVEEVKASTPRVDSGEKTIDAKKDVCLFSKLS